MQYITYKRFKTKAICGDVNIPALTICEEINGFITYNNKPLCGVTSQNAYDHFARNDDERGLERGKLIIAILNKLQKRDNSYQNRWNKLWDDEFANKFRRQEHDDHWLWSYDFYHADMESLKYILNLIENIG